MKTIHKLLLGSVAALALAIGAPAANADSHHPHHGHYVYHRGHYGYYHEHVFYPYNAGPYPYYYGPFSGPGVVIAPPAPVVVVHRRPHVFFWF
jgi:hypothetical protein